jgi:membrane associated rhomboid family serine protease
VKVARVVNRELIVASIGLLAMTIHSLDESIAFGAPSGPPWIAQTAISAFLVALCALHPRLDTWRLALAALLALLGVFVVRTGWDAHVQPMLDRGPRATDATGVLFLAGGVLLLAAGFLLVEHTLGVTQRSTSRRPIRP